MTAPGATEADTLQKLLAEQRLTNELLARIANRPQPKNVLETLRKWWDPDPSSSMRVRY